MELQRVVLLALVLAAACHGAGCKTAVRSSTSVCKIQTTWFPKKFENAAVPAPFKLASQKAAGWSGIGDPMKVITEGTTGLRVPFEASHFLLTRGLVNNTCMSVAAGLKCPIAILASAEAVQARPHKVVVTQAARYQVTWQLNEGSKQSVNVTGAKSTFVTINNLTSLVDGEYCLKVTATIIKASGVLSIDGRKYSAPCGNVTDTRTWCFTKLLGVPRATISFHSCRPNLVIKLSNPFPRPTAAQLKPLVMLGGLRVVVYGNVSKQGTAADAHIGQLGILNTFKETADWWNPSLPLLIEGENLLDGLWRFRVQVSYASMMSSLIHLTGKFHHPDNVTTYHGALLGGGTSYDITVRNTQPAISPLECKRVMVPGATEATWTLVSGSGGVFKCALDGLPKSNAPNGSCKSPLKIPLLDAQDHALEIYYTDVCGLLHHWSYSLNGQGCTKVREENDMDNVGFSSNSFPSPPLSLFPQAPRAKLGPDTGLGGLGQATAMGSPALNMTDQFGGTMTDSYTLGNGDLTLATATGVESKSKSMKSVRNLVFAIIVAVVITWFMWSDFFEAQDVDPLAYADLPDL